MAQCHIQKRQRGRFNVARWQIWRDGLLTFVPPRVETSYLPIGGVVEFVSLLPDCLTPAAPYQEARQEQERLSCGLPYTSGGWNNQVMHKRQPNGNHETEGVLLYEPYIVHAIDLYGGP